jgi:DNA-binding NarL/FixJ family response regulator
MIIDDSPSAIQKARSVLLQEGHKVETLELLIYLPERLKTDPPDLILLDLSMPALPGFDVGKLIRRYQQRPIPIVVYSSRPTTELARITKELRASDYVQKGDSDKVLVDAVNRALMG